MATSYVKVADRQKNEATEVKNNTQNNRNTDAEIAELKKQNEELHNKLEALIALMQTTNTPAPVPERDREITLVHKLQCGDGLTTHLKLTNRNIDMHVIGETRILSISEAEEVASKYRKFFERGVIAFDKDGADFARKFDLSKYVMVDTPITDFTNYVGGLDIYSLETFFKSLSEAEQAMLIETFKHKITEGDSRFKDVSKINLLERLTTAPGELHGAMEGVLVEMNNQKK